MNCSKQLISFRYRDAGKEVIDVLWSFGVCIERASIDEAYLDMTSVVSEMLSNLEGIQQSSLYTE